ncbi:3750_t:CDS:2 [Funneliformis mosseae]|uniref:3750_t:CDS:1 n=1 Tax=Funneliformis mosseae TaxID=27381 RepID=A0A9N9D6P9_FUNMO|nr:3750_t:CDS:2 [Funneliformis mosseae]
MVTIEEVRVGRAGRSDQGFLAQPDKERTEGCINLSAKCYHTLYISLQVQVLPMIVSVKESVKLYQINNTLKLNFLTRYDFLHLQVERQTAWRYLELQSFISVGTFAIVER